MGLDDVEESWKEFKTEMKWNVLGFKSRVNWISEKSWSKISERKATKSKINSAKSERLKDVWKGKYTVKDKEVKYSLRTDNRNYMDNMAKEGEEAANREEHWICCGSNSFWFKNFQTSLVFIFLCLIFITILWNKGKYKSNWFEKF